MQLSPAKKKKINLAADEIKALKGLEDKEESKLDD